MYRLKQLSTFIALLLIALLSLPGCGGAEPEATATPTRTPAPEATATPLPPTPTPLPTATPTLAPTPTPDAAVVTPFPPDVNPLTGLKVDDVAKLDRIPIAIKISNSPEVRPQSGLNDADLVFEHFAEGGITRFTTVFYANEPKQVGSVRSGRLIDLEIPKMYKALFGYSGSSAGVKERIRSSPLFPNQIAAPDFGMGEPYFYRVPQGGKAFEHTLFSNPTVLRQLATERGINQRPDYPAFMAFNETPPTGGTPVTYFEVNYLPGTCTAEWTYDEATHRWLRATAGVDQTDYLTGERLNFANVVLVYANHIETDILEDTWGGGHMSIEIQVWGYGPALVFRDGQVFSGFWDRYDPDAMLTFNDGQGHALPLKPGNTWFQMVPLGTQQAEIAEGQLRFTPEGIVSSGR